MVANQPINEPKREIAGAERPTLVLHVGPPGTAAQAAADLLESLDDAMFSAIAGDARALAAARGLWRRASELLSADLIDESREQYLRFAADLTRRFESESPRDAAKALVTVEIIELLTSG